MLKGVKKIQVGHDSLSSYSIIMGFLLPITILFLSFVCWDMDIIIMEFVRLHQGFSNIIQLGPLHISKNLLCNLVIQFFQVVFPYSIPSSLISPSSHLYWSSFFIQSRSFSLILFCMLFFLSVLCLLFAVFGSFSLRQGSIALGFNPQFSTSFSLVSFANYRCLK